MLQDGRRMAPHLCLWLVARGINTGLHTRLYFADEDVANASDPVLSLIEQQSRRDTLIAATNENGDYSFDIVLQGYGETVFFDVLSPFSPPLLIPPNALDKTEP